MAARRGLLEPGTLPRALWMGAALALALLVAARLLAGGAPQHPLDAYARLGPRVGAERLGRDLQRLSPPGADLGPAMQRLVSLGLDCAAPPGMTGEWRCVGRRPAALPSGPPGRAILHTEAVLDVREGRVAALAVTMREVTAPGAAGSR